MNKEKFEQGLFITLLWLLIGAVIALYIYTLIRYGNTPAIEAPVWVRWLLGGVINVKFG